MYLMWQAVFRSGREISLPGQQSSRGLLDWTILQGNLDLLCVSLEVLRLNVPVLSIEKHVEEVTERKRAAVLLSPRWHVSIATNALSLTTQLIWRGEGVTTAKCSVWKLRLSMKRRETLFGKYLPVDVGVADAACEVLEAAAWRPSVIERLHSRTWQGSRCWWRTFLVLFVFVIH